MASIRVVIEGETQEEVDKMCEMFADMCSLNLYRQGTHNRHADGNTWKRTTMSIPDYILRDEYAKTHKDERFGLGDVVKMNDKYFEGKKHAGETFEVKSEPFTIGGTWCVYLKGYSGAYAMDGLDKVEI